MLIPLTLFFMLILPSMESRFVFWKDSASEACGDFYKSDDLASPRGDIEFIERYMLLFRLGMNQ